METALVVLTNDNPDDQLLNAAHKYAIGVDLGLILCRGVDEEQHQSDLQRKAESGEDTASIKELEQSAKATATEIAETVFDDVPVETLGVVGDLPDGVLRIVTVRVCDHIFITGRCCSPTGKVLFGDIA